MSSCQKIHPTPSSFLALICLVLVKRLRPGWIGISIRDACRAEGESPERASRLATKALSAFEAAISTLIRIGRPARDRGEAAAEREVHLLRALLGVATEILKTISIRSDPLRLLLVGAWDRLHREHPSLTKERFAETLGVSPRTFRDWRGKATKGPPPDEAELVSPKPKKQTKAPPRPPRRRRFGFDVVVPDTQIAADTTDLRAFGTALKLVAAQDVGGRDMDLLDAVIVDGTEDADAVIAVLKEALGEDAAGQQAITDQGTPYMAKKTLEALEEINVEHAPQREADPMGKSTIERAFRTIKDIAAPILALTDKIAEVLPRLKQKALARTAAILLLTALLRAYQAGARATRRAQEERGSIEPERLAQLAEESREKARARERSSRLLLSHIHELYGFDVSRERFIRTFRRYPVSVIKDAERRFGTQVHRDDIRSRTAYFGKLVRDAFERFRQDRAAEQAQHADLERMRSERRARDANDARRRTHPERWLVEGLDLLALSCRSETRSLLFGGAGVGLGQLRAAIEHLVDVHGSTAARDIAAAVMREFSSKRTGDLGEDGVAAVLELARSKLDEESAKPEHNPDFTPGFPGAILRSTGPP